MTVEVNTTDVSHLAPPHVVVQAEPEHSSSFGYIVIVEYDVVHTAKISWPESPLQQTLVAAIPRFVAA